MMKPGGDDRSTADDLLYVVKDGVGVVTFNRPRARNALTFAMYERLAQICRTAPSDGTMKAIIITGAGNKAFASGTDISLFADFQSGGDGVAYEERMERVMSAVEDCAVPTIAAICGACTGGGAVIAALCDIRIASRDLKFGFPIARTLGNCLSAQNLSRIAALIGMGRTKDLIFLSRLIEHEEALTIGLVSEIVGAGGGVQVEQASDDKALMARALELAIQMGTQAPLTMRATKQMATRIRRGDMTDRDLIEQCYGSADFSQGVAAFMARRKPRWRGR